MQDYGAMIRSVFEMGSIRDAQIMFEICVKNAYPTNDFRRLELIRFTKEDQYREGRSWNHVFQIHATTHNDSPVWEVLCQRVTMGKAPEKRVLLDYMNLGFVKYC